MEMEYHLSTAFVTVNEDTVTVFGNAQLFGQLLCDKHHMADESFVIGRDIIRRGDVLARHDQLVMRRFGMQIIKRNDAIVLVDQGSRQFALYDFTKNAIHSIL